MKNYKGLINALEKAEAEIEEPVRTRAEVRRSIEEAILKFEKVKFPRGGRVHYNFNYMSMDEASNQDCIERYTVRTERLRNVALFPLLATVLLASQRGGGEGSDKNYLYLKGEIAKLKSYTECFNKNARLQKVQNKANTLLAPYGLKVSWKALARIYHWGSRIDEVAEFAAKFTGCLVTDISDCATFPTSQYRDVTSSVWEFDLSRLKGWHKSQTYKKEGLWGNLLFYIKLLQWEIPEFSCQDAMDHIDNTGIIVIERVRSIPLLERYEKLGCSIERHIVFGGCGYEDSVQWVVIHPLYGAFHHDYGTWQDALRRSLVAFKERKALAREEQGFIDFCERITKDINVYSVLVGIQDSFDAGNCESGTKGWLKTHGLEGRTVVGMEELLPYQQETLVRNVLKKVYQREVA